MEEPVESRRSGWQPLTRRGVAAFAPGSVGKLLLVQFLVALLSAGVMVWFLQTAWFSVIGDAIARMPPRGAIRSGTLEWSGESPARLAENHFLALVVDLDHNGGIRSPAHLQVEFGRHDLQIISIGGYLRVPYRPDWRLMFNRTELDPWWGAWRPPLTAGAAVVAVGGLLVCWGVLATLYCLPAWLAGFMADRQLSLGGSWRLAGASLMPGALLMTAAILAYGLGALDLIQLAGAAAAHVLLGWAYLIASLLSLPHRIPVPANPFQQPGSSGPDWEL